MKNIKKKITANVIQWIIYGINLVIATIASTIKVSELLDLFHTYITHLEFFTMILFYALFFSMLAVYFETIVFIIIGVFQVRRLIREKSIATFVNLIFNICSVIISFIIATMVL